MDTGPTADRDIGTAINFRSVIAFRKAWEDFRRLQVRQLFRLSMEALFWWTLGILSDTPKSMEAMVSVFLGELTQAF